MHICHLYQTVANVTNTSRGGHGIVDTEYHIKTEMFDTAVSVLWYSVSIFKKFGIRYGIYIKIHIKSIYISIILANI